MTNNKLFNRKLISPMDTFQLVSLELKREEINEDHDDLHTLVAGTITFGYHKTQFSKLMLHGSVMVMLVIYGEVLRITYVLNHLDYMCVIEFFRPYKLRWKNYFRWYHV